MADDIDSPENSDDQAEQEVDSSGLEAAAQNAVEASEFGVPSGGNGPVGEDCPECKKGAPAWMATFADMATLLMAFFVLILSFSDTEVPRFEYINGSIDTAFGVRQSIPKISIPMGRSLLVENFTPNPAARSVLDNPRQQQLDPTAKNLIRRTDTSPERFVEEIDATKIALAEQIQAGLVVVTTDGQQIVVRVKNNTSGGGDFGSGKSEVGSIDQTLIDTAAIVAEIQATISREIGVYLSDFDNPEPEKTSEELVYSAQAEEDNLNNKYENIRTQLDSEISNGLLEVEREGDDIIIRIASQGSFQSGSATLAQSFIATLNRIGMTVGDESGGIRVEGHTDNIPVAFSDRFNSNWDLSAARASSVASYLTTESGLLSDRVEVVGFADTVPLDSNESSEGRSRNRRIEIRIAE